jgi:hypothetical protein
LRNSKIKTRREPLPPEMQGAVEVAQCINIEATSEIPAPAAVPLQIDKGWIINRGSIKQVPIVGISVTGLLYIQFKGQTLLPSTPSTGSALGQ